MTLTFYCTVPAFNDTEKEAFGKHCMKRKKCGFPALSPSLTRFLCYQLQISPFLTAFELLSADAFKVVKVDGADQDQSTNLLK